MISLKKLHSLSLATFALCFMSFTTEAAAHQNCPKKAELIYRTDAIVQSQSLVGKFMMGFTAAVNAPDLTTQQALVLELTDLLTDTFTVKYNLEFNSIKFTLTATDYDSLLIVVQTFARQSKLTTNLTGNFNVDNYTSASHHLRNLDLNFQSYGVSTNAVGTTVSAFNGNTHIVEVSCDEFKIETITSSVITDAVILNP